MCYSCWLNQGAPFVTSDEVLEAAELIRHLYEDLGQRTGGPLHWMLDDMNIDDGQLEGAIGRGDQVFAYLWDGTFERYAQAGDDVSVEHRRAIQETCEKILSLFAEMPEVHRASAIGWYEGFPLQYLDSEYLIRVVSARREKDR